MACKDLVYEFLLKCGYLSGGFSWLQKKITDSRLSILMYHAVVDNPLVVPDWCFIDVEKFRNQLVYLKKFFDIISLEKAVWLLQNGGFDRPTAVVTFDDGFQNNFDVAFPILQDLQIPATIFLSTELINTNRTLWFCQINKALTETTNNELVWNGVKYDLKNSKNKAKSSSLIQAKLKEYEHSVLLDELKQICLSLAVPFNSKIGHNSPYRMLDKASIVEMASSGLIDFGAHTANHIILSKVPSAIVRNELINSIKAVANLTGKACAFFSYPNGRYQDFDGSCIKILKDQGIVASVTTESGANDAETPLMKLKRYGIGQDITIERFSFTVHSLLDVYRIITRSHLKIN